MSTPQTWQVVIQKLLGTEYWVNDYHVQADTQTAAFIAAESIIEAERAIHQNNVTFVNFRIRNAAGGGQGTVYPIGQTGQGTPADWLPLFCTVRIDMAVETGRPGRKYLRLPLNDSGQENGQITPAALTNITNNYCLPIQNLGVVCKPNGQLFTLVRPVAAVQMRQLRRGSKRRTQPII